MPNLELKTCEIDPGVKIFCAYDAYVLCSELRPQPKNPNVHPLEQVRLLWKLIAGAGEQSHGWRAPIVVSNQTGFITRGHGRLLAARYGGLKGVPVDYQDYESPEQELADVMADNIIADLSYMDDGIVENNIAELKRLNDNFDFELIGSLPDLSDISEAVAKITRGERVDKTEKEEGLHPIIAKVNEQYDYVLILCENETDQQFMRGLIGVRKERSIKQREIGQGRAIKFTRFLESLRANRASLFPPEKKEEKP